MTYRHHRGMAVSTAMPMTMKAIVAMSMLHLPFKDKFDV